MQEETNHLPPTLLGVAGAGYRWSANYVYPRRFWRDVRIGDMVNVSIQPENKPESLDLHLPQPLQQPVLPPRETIDERRVR